MGPKKKQPKNPFYFFMVDWREEKKQQGIEYPGGWKEVALACDDDWKHLPHQMVERYKLKAQEAKEKDKHDLANKFTSLGVSYLELQAEQREKNLFETQMKTEISETLSRISRSITSLMNHKFFIIHANYYCYWREKNIFIPCEVAVLEFTLGGGIGRTHHLFPGIFCTENGSVPLGYLHDVKDHATKTHEIPPPPFQGAEDDLEAMEVNFREFLCPQGGPVPPLYTMEDDLNTNCSMSTIQNFLNTISDADDSPYRLYKLPLLFFNLLETCVEEGQKENDSCPINKLPTVSLAQAQLERDTYNFTAGLCCDYHEGKDSMQYCSLAVVKRWAFVMCYFCGRALDIEFVPGKHCPMNAVVPETHKGQKVQTKPKPVSCTELIQTSATACQQSTQRPVWPKPGQSSPRSAPVCAQAAPVSESNEDSEWSTVSRGWGRGKAIQDTLSQGMRGVRIQDQQPGPSSAQRMPGGGTRELNIIDHSVVKDTTNQRVYKIGQAPNVVSEIMPNSEKGQCQELRRPRTRGQGEMLASLLNKDQGPSFTNNDFPAIGGGRPRSSKSGPSFSDADFPAVGAQSNVPASGGRLAKPIASAWGRGFSSGS